MENVIVRKMIRSLGAAAKREGKENENYNKQLMLYRKLISESDGTDEREMICARCLLSLSRSMLLGNHSEKSVNCAKNELSFLCKTIDKKNVYSKEIKDMISERINSLSQIESDELVDSVIFVYHSILNGGETA